MRLKKEHIYYIILSLLLFVFLFLDEEKRDFKTGYILIAVNYALCSTFISYVLIPFFCYKKRIVGFVILTILALFVNVVIEELVIEPIFLDFAVDDELNELIFSVAHTIPVMIILVGFKFFWDINMRRKQLDIQKQLMIENEMQLLRSQINPHFLFNNLNNIYSYAIEQSPKTPSLIYELSQVLRYMLYSCKEKYVLLKDEIQHLDNYVRLNELQVESRGCVEFIADDSIEGYRIAPSILFVFVENAFKHSLSSLSENIRILIRIEILDDTLFFFCKNNHSSASNVKDIEGGIGLKNVKAQLNLIYPESHELTIQETDDSYSVKLSIKLKETD